MPKIIYTPGEYLADEYLALKAQQAELAARELALKQALLQMGRSVIEGTHARVTISEAAGAEGYDRAKLEALVPQATLAACRKVGAPSIRFAVKARIADAGVAA